MALQVQESPGTGEEPAWHSFLPPKSDSHLRRKECRKECVETQSLRGSRYLSVGSFWIYALKEGRPGGSRVRTTLARLLLAGATPGDGSIQA